MVLIQLYASFDKFWRIVRDVRISNSFHGLLSYHGFARLTLDPLRCQALCDYGIFAVQSRLFLFIENLVIHRNHTPNFSSCLAMSARSSGFLLHGALETFVRLRTSQFGPFGKRMKKSVFFCFVGWWFRYRMRERWNRWLWNLHVSRRGICPLW